ncbi:MAG: HAMP domain-containing protein [Chloroflexi bacterium]|nr:HAMP domain-containing protein [Chloroflexota bacterium]
MKLSLQTQLLVAGAALSLLILGIGLVGWWQVRAVNEVLSTDTVVHANARFNVAHIGGLVGEFNDTHSEYLLNIYSDKLTLRAERAKSAKTIEAAFDVVGKWIEQPDEKASLVNLRTAFASFDKVGLAMLDTQDAVLNKRQSGASASEIASAEAGVANTMIAFDDLRGKLYEQIDSLAMLESNLLEGSKAAAASQVTQAIWILLSLTVIGATICMIIAIVTARIINHAVTSLLSAALAIAKGEVDQQVTYRAGNELGVLADSFREMIDYFREMVAVAAQLAQGDLTAEVKPRSDRDALGNAFSNCASWWGGLPRTPTTSPRLRANWL